MVTGWLYNPQILVAVASICFVYVVYKVLRLGMRESYLPPGPPTLPILGNLHLFPKKDAHFQFHKWAEEYGKIYSLKLGPGQTAVVLTSPQALNDILNKKSSITADRPRIHFADRITGGLNLTVSHYTEAWKSLRRGATEILTQQACREHLTIQQAEATQLAYDFMTKPDEFALSIRRYAISVMFSVLFGKRIPRYASTAATEFFDMMTQWVNILAPGAHPPVDIFPILKYVPEWFAEWKKQCNHIRELQRRIYFGLLGEVEKRMASGQGNGSFLETIVQRGEQWGLDRERKSYLGGILLEGGADTTSAYLTSFVLLITAHPEVQEKAKRELDAVIGTERMPVLDDIDRLPYIQAIILEVHRYRPITPLNFPHAAMEDIKYEGYMIPKGTSIYANAWGLYNDAELFPEPEKFNPDRFLGKNGAELAKIMGLAFGNGRRSCPGIYLAKNAINLNAMNMLWSFNFLPPLDSNGKEKKIDTLDYAVGVSYCPNPFKCRILPRTPHHAELIRLQLRSFNEAFSQFEYLLDDTDKAYVKELREKLETE